MLRIFADFESYYDNKEYTLRKMSPIEYILDGRWETLGCAVAIEREPAMLFKQDEVADFLRDIKQPYCVITHNALFDACILAYRYNIHPDGLLCTLSMARAVLLHQIPNGKLSLANLLKYLGYNPKGDFIQNMSGKHFSDLATDGSLMAAWAGYTVNDLDGCRNIFFHLAPLFPRDEALVLDRMIRMTTQPKLHVDTDALWFYRNDLKEAQNKLLASVIHDRSVLMSNPQFALALEQLGVEPPMKISPTTGEPAFAFAKSDQGFVDLLDHDNIEVQTLVAARLGIKSTIEETRSERLMNIGTRAEQHLGAPLLPCPLRFSGAHTHRYSGDWKLNMQNLSARRSREIRKAIIAPPGYTIVAVDAAQIEGRLTAWLAEELTLLGLYRDGEDVYRNFAAQIFQVKDVREVTKMQRFVGKQCILGLGFGMSGRKLYLTIVNLARQEKLDVSWITQDMCDAWVQVYRRSYRSIAAYWDRMNFIIRNMCMGSADDQMIGPCRVEGTTIIGPSGLRLYYHNLRYEEGEYWYNYGQFPKKIYGGKMLENVVQHLDRQHVVEAGIRTELRAKELGIPDPRVLLNVHDENVHCVPDEYAVTLAGLALEEMRRNVPWSEGLPLNAEVKLGKNFGEMQSYEG